MINVPFSPGILWWYHFVLIGLISVAFLLTCQPSMISAPRGSNPGSLDCQSDAQPIELIVDLFTAVPVTVLFMRLNCLAFYRYNSLDLDNFQLTEDRINAARRLKFHIYISVILPLLNTWQRMWPKVRVTMRGNKKSSNTSDVVNNILAKLKHN